MFPTDLIEEAARLLTAMRARGLKIATAESCTGGLIVGALTEVAGSSDVVERSFITYSNAAKVGMLGVDYDLIRAHGAVSAEVARAMAEGALRCSAADVAVSATGVAGPGGGSPGKPVGLVHLGIAKRGEETRHRECRFGDIGRHAIRIASVREAFALVSETLAR